MLEEALKKIREEMGKNKAPYIQTIGNYVLTQIEVNANAVEEIEKGNKTLKEALEKVRSEAKKVAVNNCAVLTDEEVFKIVKRYYKFTAEQPNATKVVIVHEEEEHKKPEEEHKNFSVDLKDLLRRNKK